MTAEVESPDRLTVLLFTFTGVPAPANRFSAPMDDLPSSVTVSALISIFPGAPGPSLVARILACAPRIDKELTSIRILGTSPPIIPVGPPGTPANVRIPGSTIPPGRVNPSILTSSET